MKVGIFETTHFEGAYPVIRLFDNGSNEVTIFTYEESYRQFQFLFGEELSKFRWIVKKQNESKYKFIRRMYKAVKEYNLQLLYLNTISDNFIFYAWMIGFLQSTRVIVTLHSINNYFSHKPAFSLRRMLRIIGKKRLMKVVNEFNVVALTMVDYLQNRLSAFKKVHCVPGAVYEEKPFLQRETGQRKISSLVVPGMVDPRRRDYHLIIQLIEELVKANLEMTITCLGGIHPDFGYEVLQQFKNVKPVDRLKFYDVNEVDQPEFDRVMDEADLVFVPSAIHISIQDDIPEIYGLSMSSGNLFDIIKHAKPFIAPLALRVDPFLEESCLRYESLHDIVEILTALSDSPEAFHSLQLKARAASTNYTIEAVRKRNKELFG